MNNETPHNLSVIAVLLLDQGGPRFHYLVAKVTSHWLRGGEKLGGLLFPCVLNRFLWEQEGAVIVE